MRAIYQQNDNPEKSQLVLKALVRLAFIILIIKLITIGINSWPLAKRSIIDFYRHF